ncbi:hypothetical protein LCGC14_2560710 [marine sediment metagenome]|uniref:Electron transport complex subunit RsxE n=1 Tax=marine sediment metagenome TaxID=412755 RepID=A0A0F9DD85_9ZZZZ
MDNRTLREIFNDGIFSDNTVFKLAISLCPTIAVTNSLKNGFFLGGAVLMVQVLVNATVSLLRHFIHPRIRIPIFMLVISGWVSMVDMLMAAYVRDVYAEIGLFIQIIVAYASILAHAESFASKNKVGPSVVDGFGMGLGYLIALIIISFVRELLGLLGNAFVRDFLALALLAGSVPVALVAALRLDAVSLEDVFRHLDSVGKDARDLRVETGATRLG